MSSRMGGIQMSNKYWDNKVYVWYISVYVYLSSQTVNSVDPVAMMKHSMSGISDQQVHVVVILVHLACLLSDNSSNACLLTCKAIFYLIYYSIVSIHL